MSHILSSVRRAARHLGWLVVCPLLAVCSSANPAGTFDTSPGTVSDLAVQATTQATATLSFTQVDDGTGQPANYDVRYAVAPLSWGSAASVASGTCATPVAGAGIGTAFSCTVLGLSPSTSYNFQVKAFRGAMNAGAVVGGLSNLAAASTLSGSAPPPVVTTVTVSPSSASVAVGATTPLQAAVKDQNGSVMTGETIDWSSSNTGAATVNSTGVVTGVAAGSATITAATGGKSGTSGITVTAVPVTPVVTTVTVAPTSASVVAGATTPLTATVKDQNGSVMTGQTITWTTSNSAAATVNSSGVVTGVAAGSATITATSSAKTGTAAITVTAVAPVVTTVTVAPTSASVVAGATTPLTATVKDQNGNAMTGQTVTWTTSNSAAATVNSSGVVTGVAAGSATITATSLGKTGTSSITVTAVQSGGGTLLFQEDFENSSLASRGWYDNTGVLLSTVEHITGSTSSAEYRFPAGATSPTSGSAQRHKFTPTNSLFISYYVKYSANWVGSRQSYHPHEFYAMSTLDGDYDGPSANYLTIYLEHNYQNGGKPVMSIQDNLNINYSMGSLPNNLVGVTENRSTGGCNGMSETNMYSECFSAGSTWYNLKQLSGPVVFQPTAGPGYKNSWNFVEAYYQLNTVVGGIGQANGVMQYWFNGTLIIDRHDIVFRTGAHPTVQFNQFLIAPYIGDGSPVAQSMWVDNLKVGTGRLP